MKAESMFAFLSNHALSNNKETDNESDPHSMREFVTFFWFPNPSTKNKYPMQINRRVANISNRVGRSFCITNSFVHLLKLLLFRSYHSASSLRFSNSQTDLSCFDYAQHDQDNLDYSRHVEHSRNVIGREIILHYLFIVCFFQNNHRPTPNPFPIGIAYLDFN